jgi:hypothetical protein
MVSSHPVRCGRTSLLYSLAQQRTWTFGPQLLCKSQNGDRQAIDAISFLAEKIGRVDDVNSTASLRGGIMLVPGVAKSSAEWNIAAAAKRKRGGETQITTSGEQ